MKKNNRVQGIVVIDGTISVNGEAYITGDSIPVGVLSSVQIEDLKAAGVITVDETEEGSGIEEPSKTEEGSGTGKSTQISSSGVEGK